MFYLSFKMRSSRPPPPCRLDFCPQHPLKLLPLPLPATVSPCSAPGIRLLRLIRGLNETFELGSHCYAEPCVTSFLIRAQGFEVRRRPPEVGRSKQRDNRRKLNLPEPRPFSTQVKRLRGENYFSVTSAKHRWQRASCCFLTVHRLHAITLFSCV